MSHGQSPVGLICWWCVHALPIDPAIHLPIKYDSKLDRFSSIGNFCSWQCAKAYALDMGTSRSGEIQSFLAIMRRRSIGRYEPLWPAPKRQALKCFGGHMTIEEFRSYGGLIEPPRIHFPFEKLYFATMGGDCPASANIGIIPKQVQNSGKLKAIENSSTETDTLRLKRTKPLSRATSKLENALGLKRKEK
jgi:MYM-type Zinc finger with FCS sequence motif